MNSSNKAGRTRTIRLILVGAGGLCGLGLLNSALAFPPLNRGSSSSSTTESARSPPAVGRSPLRQAIAAPAPLDLRPPQEKSSATNYQGAGALAAASFPSAIHHSEPGKTEIGGEDRGTGDQMRSSVFGAHALSFQGMSQGQILAQRIQRIHREGLPIARLWESKSAALSIGLNQRGKPGLWFAQSMH